MGGERTQLPPSVGNEGVRTVSVSDATLAVRAG
jgi:hypothetical protein